MIKFLMKTFETFPSEKNFENLIKKAIKNKKEIKNIKLAHIYDGIALTKYLFWLKKNFQNVKI